MKKEVIISLSGVSKSFHKKGATNHSIRDYIFNFWKKKDKKRLKALSNINFEVYKGETFGIIGRNGSGKSTLIHLIMGSMKADKGSQIYSKGKMLRLALGMGMDPNLTGRDNVYINGSILGLSFKYIGDLFDDIISYANLEDFVDTPVKNYSKGMQARLKFSIAMHADADIFLLDEFFGGVGDEDFKKKSNDAFQKTIIENKTIIIVSHSKKIIRKHCTRALWIDKGKMKIIGTPQKVVKAYEASFKQKKMKNDK